MRWEGSALPCVCLPWRRLCTEQPSIANVMAILSLLFPDQLRHLHSTHVLNSLHALLQVIDKVKEENFKRDGVHALLPQTQMLP